jgi:hypothetical protein
VQRPGCSGHTRPLTQPVRRAMVPYGTVEVD